MYQDTEIEYFRRVYDFDNNTSGIGSTYFLNLRCFHSKGISEANKVICMACCIFCFLSEILNEIDKLSDVALFHVS